MRRILSLAGYDIKIGTPGEGDMVAVWGKSPTAPRGEKIAERHDAPVLRVEDALLRSVLPGRLGSPPIGLLLDRRGVHFDSSVPSDIEHLLKTHPLDDTALLNRARAAIDRLQDSHLSKYNNFDPDLPVPDPGYVLVIDQTRDDASIIHGAANAATFREMLVFAQEEHPGAPVVIKTHPETNAGTRDGHFGPEDENHRISLCSAPVSPWKLLENARAVYTVSSGLGFEAIFAGHRPRVFGQPFYAGWGLTTDENPVARRERKLTRAQLFAAAMILYPTWYDPTRDQLCEAEDAIGALEAETRQWREDSAGYVAMAMRLWKRQPLQHFFGAQRVLKFEDFPRRASAKARDENRRLMIWAGHEDPRIRAEAGDIPLLRIEDGFLRSRGLGAALVPPMSLVADDLGIYYDPSRESRLERLIATRAKLTDGQKLRAETMIYRLIRAGVTKYNLPHSAPEPLAPDPGQKVILVPGQVEDDASVRLGCREVDTNAELLRVTRAANPDALILYKPHPDCEAGLRNGGLDAEQARQWADQVLTRAAPVPLIDACDEVWTMSSLLGFEALIRGKKVTCLGVPFYAGWGLTRDLSPVPARRKARPELAGLVHAALIDYPRYYDPVSRRPCSVEVVVTRLASGTLPAPAPGTRILAKLQGIFASQAWLWRR